MILIFERFLIGSVGLSGTDEKRGSLYEIGTLRNKQNEEMAFKTIGRRDGLWVRASSRTTGCISDGDSRETRLANACAIYYRFLGVYSAKFCDFFCRFERLFPQILKLLQIFQIASYRYGLQLGFLCARLPGVCEVTTAYLLMRYFKSVKYLVEKGTIAS